MAARFCPRGIVRLLVGIVLAVPSAGVLAAVGDLDTTFNAGTGATGCSGSSCSTTWISETILLPDGKLLVGGNFKFFNGNPVNHIARLNADGSFDSSFAVVNGTDKIIADIALQADGKILIAGRDVTAARFHISRLNNDGTLDSTFTGSTSADGTLKGLLVQDDGKIIVSSDTSSYAGNTVYNILRLNTDGSLDTSFNPGTGCGFSPKSCSASVLLADGKIIVAGYFPDFNGVARKNIVRLKPDGTVDPSFNTGIGPNATVNSVLRQSDGKLVIAGTFTAVDGIARSGIARLEADGTLDTTFAPPAFGNIYSATLQPDGRIIAVGWNYARRFNSDGSLDSAFSVAGAFSSSPWNVDIQTDGMVVVSPTVPVRLDSGAGDGDGIYDAGDNCPLIDNVDQLDTDQDSIGDACDASPNGSDMDTDGIDDLVDNCPFVSNVDQVDVDDDEAGDVCDVFPADAAEWRDTDSDTVGDHADNCRSTMNTDQVNTDGDMYGNACDADMDNDSVANSSDAFPLNSEASKDTDNDGMPDSLLPKAAAFTSPNNLVWTTDSMGNAGNWATDYTTGGVKSGFVGYAGSNWMQISYTATNAGRVVFLYQMASCSQNQTAFTINNTAKPMPCSTVWSESEVAWAAGSKTLKWAATMTTNNLYVSSVRIFDSALIEDLDDDNDGVPDASDAFPLNAAEWLDSDTDGIGNNADMDDDNDGVPDSIDAAPLDPGNTQELLLPLDGQYRGSAMSVEQRRQ